MTDIPHRAQAPIHDTYLFDYAKQNTSICSPTINRFLSVKILVFSSAF